MRILHAPTVVGGQSRGLSLAERELGHTSDVAVFGPEVYGYGADLRLDLTVSKPLLAARKLAFVRRAMRDYDVIHLNFGRSMMPLELGGRMTDEIPLLKRAGKTVLVTFQGCDVRPSPRCPCNYAECDADTPRRARNAARMLRVADRVFFLNPDLREWLPGASFLPYASVDPRRFEAGPASDRDGADGREVVVAHAPTDRDIKGSEFVIAAVESLRAEGVAVRLELLEGMEHAEVVERCRDADVVVDQMLLGWYGAFAVEAMAMGKPVLCRIAEEVPEDNPFGEELPIVRTRPETLVDDLRALAQDPERRARVGRESRDFAERRHDPLRIAQSILEGIGAPASPAASGAAATASG